MALSVEGVGTEDIDGRTVGWVVVMMVDGAEVGMGELRPIVGAEDGDRKSGGGDGVSVGADCVEGLVGGSRVDGRFVG